MSDLIERLRELATETFGYDPDTGEGDTDGNCEHWNVIQSAADEIERLRRELAEARQREMNARCTVCGSVFFTTTADQPGVTVCMQCGGRGTDTEMYRDYDGNVTTSIVRCEKCDGSGHA